MTQDLRHQTPDTRLRTVDTRLLTLKSQVSCFVSPSKLTSLLCVLCLASCVLLPALPSFAQTSQEDMQAEPEVYHESALRRFEIVFTISLPFTALHSYLAVRGVEMIKQRKVAPTLHRGNWNAVGGLTILFSGFAAFWDWRHTRGEDISDTTIMPRGRTRSLESLKSSNVFDDLNGFNDSIEYRVLSTGF